MKKVMNRIWMLAVLTIVSMAATAQVRVDLNESYTGGSISAAQADPAEDGSVLVTLTVAPEKGYYIAKKDIQVVATISPSGTRAPEVVSDIELVGDDPEDLTKERDYTFTVKANYGAWVREANFHVVEEQPQPEPEPQPQEPTNDISAEGSNVTWTYDTDNSTMTITGEGSTVDFGGESDPWASVRAQVTSVVIEKGVTSLGANIFAGCTSLTSIRIDNANQVLKMGEGAIPANEGLVITVPAMLLNEYWITDGWGSLKVVGDGAEQMKGIEFSASNQYDTFSAGEKAMIVPSVLKAYAITGLNGTKLELTEVSVVTPGMAVLVFNERDLQDTDFYTTVTDAEPSRTANLLKVATEETPVKLGEVFLLYNDVFYYSQAGNIPAGGIYLSATSEMRTRGSYSLHDNSGTTAIGSIYINKVEGHSAWYTLDGRQLPTAPTSKGIYIKDGKKVVIK